MTIGLPCWRAVDRDQTPGESNMAKGGLRVRSDGSGSGGRVAIFQKDAGGVTFQILVLPVAERSAKRDETRDPEDERNGDQKDDQFHGGPFSRIAFRTMRVKADRNTAWEFLEHLLKTVPYRIHTILTDNHCPAGDLRGKSVPQSRP